MLLSNRLGLVIVFLSLLLFGCTSIVSENEPDEVVVFAASSLTNVLEDMKIEFETLYPEVKIRINFAGSKTLRSQIENGAQPDLFLSANKGHYMSLHDQDMFQVGGPLVENTMVIITHKESEKNIQHLKDLTGDVQLVLAEQSVPAGAYAHEILKKFDFINDTEYYENITSNLVSEESNVRQVLMKVTLGEADAGFVYKTDVIKSVRDKIKVTEIEDVYKSNAVYYGGILKESEKETAQLFYDFVMGQIGQQIFESHGFIIK